MHPPPHEQCWFSLGSALSVVGFGGTADVYYYARHGNLTAFDLFKALRALLLQPSSLSISAWRGFPRMFLRSFARPHWGLPPLSSWPHSCLSWRERSERWVFHLRFMPPPRSFPPPTHSPTRPRGRWGRRVGGEEHLLLRPNRATFFSSKESKN